MNAPCPDSGVRSVAIAGTGSYLPERIVSNKELETLVDTTDEWIYSRTGIRERRIAREDQATSDLAAEAARAALAAAALEPEAVDLILVATITPDMPFPNTACFVQQLIGASRAACFSLEAACSGFLYALETARNFVAAGTYDHVLVIGAEKMSAMLDWQDRATCVLFGDGAGAAVVRPTRKGGILLRSVMGGDGSLAHLLMTPGGGSRYPTSEQTLRDRMHYLRMEGREVFKHAVTRMTAAAQEALERSGVDPAQVACVIPHQANLRIVSAVASRLGVPSERLFLNLDTCGNTSGASIGIALDQAVRQGRIQPGDAVLMFAFGGGFTWAATVLRWE